MEVTSEEWKTVRNAQEEYLQNKQGFVIVKTILKDKNHDVIQDMVEWCEHNVLGSWSYASLAEYHHFVTFRMWDKNAANRFKNMFIDYLME